MTLVPRFFNINEVSDKHINDIKSNTGEKVVIDYKDWKNKQNEKSE